MQDRDEGLEEAIIAGSEMSAFKRGPAFRRIMLAIEAQVGRARGGTENLPPNQIDKAVVAHNNAMITYSKFMLKTFEDIIEVGQKAERILSGDSDSNAA